MKKIYMLEELLHEIVPMLYNFRKECRTHLYSIKFIGRKTMKILGMILLGIVLLVVVFYLLVLVTAWV